MAINIGMDLKYQYHGYTLIDITKTDVLSYTKDQQKQRNQQRNWETVNQILGLRAQLLEFSYLGSAEVNLNDYSFGVDYTGMHRVWQFVFVVDRPDIYSLDTDRYGSLKDDFKIAPIILELDETAKPPMALFYVSGPSKNIYFKSDTN